MGIVELFGSDKSFINVDNDGSFVYCDKLSLSCKVSFDCEYILLDNISSLFWDTRDSSPLV